MAHRYNNVLYPVQGHYDTTARCSSWFHRVLTRAEVDIVCWFHGWYNHIDSVLSYFEIARSNSTASGRNAILVIPESAKDAPDSYGGKLEQQGRFRLLLEDVLAKLKKKRSYQKSDSGKYHTRGPQRRLPGDGIHPATGGIEINEANLFDGMYGQADRHINWLQADSLHRFINIYTNKGGGTDKVSAELATTIER